MTKSDGMNMLKEAIVVLVTIVVSMTGFWMMIGRDFTTKSEVEAIVATKMLLVDQKLEIYINEQKLTRAVIEKNTDAINELKLQFSVMSQIVKNHDIKNRE